MIDMTESILFLAGFLGLCLAGPALFLVTLGTASVLRRKAGRK